MSYKNYLMYAACLFQALAVAGQDSTRWSLQECIDYAIAHNIDIRQAANEAEQNKISVNTAKWARLPNLNGGVSQGWSWGRTASPKDNSYSDTNSSSTGVNLSTNVPLFTGLQLSNQYSLAMKKHQFHSFPYLFLRIYS